MHFDEILTNHVGAFGRYQKILLLLCGLPIASVAMHTFSWTFSDLKEDFRCAQSGESQNSTFGDISCADIQQCKAEACSGSCERVIFNKTEDRFYASEQFEYLRCHHDEVSKAIPPSYFVGQLIGSFTVGTLSDRFGRKKLYCSCLLILVASGFGLSITTNLWIFIFLRVVLGAMHVGIYMLSVVISTEFLVPKHRKISSLICSLGFVVGQTVVGVEAYFITNYRWFLAAIAFPTTFFVSYYWFIRESPRWLISQKRIEEATLVLKKAAKFNGKSLPEDWHNDLRIEEKDEKSIKSQLFDLFRTSEMRKRTLINSYLWTVGAYSYYTVSLTPEAIGFESRYLIFTVSAAMAIIVNVILYVTLDRAGRRYVTAAAYAVAGFTMFVSKFLGERTGRLFAILDIGSCLVFPSVPSFPISTRLFSEELDFPKFVLLIVDVVCRCSLHATFTVIYTYSPEMFPTPIRSTAMGLFSAGARVASTFATVLMKFDEERISWRVMGILCLLVLPLTLFLLPETAEIDLPETISDIEAGSKTKKRRN